MTKNDSGEFDKVTSIRESLSGIWSEYEGKNYVISFTVYIAAENKHKYEIVLKKKCDTDQ